MLSQAKLNHASLSRRDWLTLGSVTVVASIMMVLLVQAFALAFWPDIKSFDPLNSFLRSALFTAVPVAGATFLFAFLDSRMAEPAGLFNKIAIAVLIVSIIPDFLLPVANKIFLASSVTAFLHVVAASMTVMILQQGYKWLKPAV